MMKRLFILSAGTSAAWYLIKSAKKWYPGNFEIIAGDIYPKELIPASTLADRFIQLPPIKSASYYEEMIQLIDNIRPDYIVPIIDDDLFFFPCDNPDLQKMGVTSSAPKLETTRSLSDKRKMATTLDGLKILSPIVIETIDEIRPSIRYFCKPVKGHGSIGVELRQGEDFPNDYNFTENLVQVACNQEIPELTIDTFCLKDKIRVCARKRLAVKAGVCVKATFYNETDLNDLIVSIGKVNSLYPLPLASCVQFMKDYDGKWNLTDFNLRLGAGTALSDAGGFQIGRAMLSVFLGKKTTDDLFQVDYSLKSVARVYEEIIIR